MIEKEKFERHLRGTSLSENTISSYMFAIKQYGEQYDDVTEYSGQFYTVIPEVGNRRSDVKETVIPEPWKPWFLPL